MAVSYYHYLELLGTLLSDMRYTRIVYYHRQDYIIIIIICYHCYYYYYYYHYYHYYYYENTLNFSKIHIDFGVQSYFFKNGNNLFFSLALVSVD